MPGTEVELSQPAAYASSVRVTTGGIEMLLEIAGQWAELCSELAATEPYYRPEWTIAYLQAFAPDAKLVLFTAWDGTRLRGLLPLLEVRTAVSKLPATVLRFPANSHNARFDLLVCDGIEGDHVLRELWNALAAFPRWDVLDLKLTLERSNAARLAEIASEHHYPAARILMRHSLFFPIPDSNPQSVLESTSRKFRANVRRARKQIEEFGPVVVRHTGQADHAALQTFYDLERSGWKGQRGTAIACKESTRKFYDDIARAAADSGYLSLDSLEVGGKPISSHFGLSLNGRYFLLKAGYDEEFKRFGPGQLLVSEIVQQSAERGLREFDFVGPATWDESRWTSESRKHFGIFIFRRGIYGSLLHFARFSGRRILKKILRMKLEDENAPLELTQPRAEAGS